MGVQFSANVQKLFDSRPDKTRVIDGNRTLSWPFIDRQGNDEQSYVIHMVGAAERAKTLADENCSLTSCAPIAMWLCVPAGEKR